MSCHGFGLFEPHQVEDRRGYVGQDTVADRFHAVGNHDDRHRIERMSRIGRAVGIEAIVSVGPRQLEVAMVEIVGMVVDHVEDHANARLVQCLHHLLELPYAPPYRRWRNSGR